jgi:prepilin-type N-terminal cleavage/methylation domain-containing protein
VNVQMKISKNNGFSLVELVIVIVIIGVLAAVAVPIYRNNVQKAIRSEVLVTMGFVTNFLEIYYGENGYYPITSDYQKVVGAPWNDIASGMIRGTYIRGGINTYYNCADGVEYEIRIYEHDYLDEDYWVNQDGEYNWEITE